MVSVELCSTSSLRCEIRASPELAGVVRLFLSA